MGRCTGCIRRKYTLTVHSDTYFDVHSKKVLKWKWFCVYIDSGMYTQTLIQLFQSNKRAVSRIAGFFMNRDYMWIQNIRGNLRYHSKFKSEIISLTFCYSKIIHSQGIWQGFVLFNVWILIALHMSWQSVLNGFSQNQLKCIIAHIFFAS